MKREKNPTKMKLPEFVERLSLALPAEEEHGVEELDGGVRVQAAGPRLTPHRAPRSRYWY